ncbi:MAG: hypothetical protein H5U07_03860 [Candidatus Aminicenantes bacterium]|nr:hypothetical protein [Candidatus Aminicenantes bacterium]
MELDLINFNQFQEKLELGLKHLEKEDFLKRLLKKDFTLWKDQDQEITNRLGWMESPLSMQGFLADYKQEGRELEAEGIKHVVLLGMGGSSLAPKTINDLLSSPGRRQFTMLDSTCPEEILKVARMTDRQAGETMFIVSSKSGTTTETLCFLNFFYARQKKILGRKAGHYFVAITDPGTPLEKIARSLEFRKIIPGFPEVGGRFSALSPFGLFPAGLLGLDLEKFLTPAVKSCLNLKNGSYQHPGLRLGLALGKLAVEGYNKLTLFLPTEWKSFGRWLEQLIAESTGKEGRGIVPVVESMPISTGNYSQDRVFVLYSPGEMVDVFQTERLQRISRSHPLIHITGQSEELAEHFYAATCG